MFEGEQYAQKFFKYRHATARVHGRLFRRATAPLSPITTATWSSSLAGVVKPPALGLNSKLLSRLYREIALAAVTASDEH